MEKLRNDIAESYVVLIDYIILYLLTSTTSIDMKKKINVIISCKYMLV